MLPFSSPPSTQHFGTDGRTGERKRINTWHKNTFSEQCFNALVHRGRIEVVKEENNLSSGYRERCVH